MSGVRRRRGRRRYTLKRNIAFESPLGDESKFPLLDIRVTGDRKVSLSFSEKVKSAMLLNHELGLQHSEALTVEFSIAHPALKNTNYLCVTALPRSAVLRATEEI